MNGSGEARRHARTASSTPGMNELRSIESWRIVSVWPSPPRITSWWATRPGRRTEWIGSWTLPPASAISSAVRFAVPDGRVELAVVMQLDDLAPRALAGPPRRRTASSAPRRSRSWGRRGRWPCRPSPAPPRPQRGPRRGRTRWSRRPRGRPRRGRRRMLAAAASGVVKSTTTSASPSSSPSACPERGVGPSGELHVVGALDRLADGLAHPPGGARDDDADHGRSAARRRSSRERRARRRRGSAPRRGPTQAAAKRSGS